MAHVLDTLATDYDSVRSRLISILQSYDIIKDMYKSSTSIQIVELLAYCTELLNFYINEAKNEMNIDTAQRRSTLLGLAKALGYNTYYGVPARGTVSVSFKPSTIASGTVTIPKFTYINSIQNINFMTTQDYTLSNVSTTAWYNLLVRQGIIRQSALTTSADATPYQTYKIPSRFVTVPNNYDNNMVDIVLYCDVAQGGTGGQPWLYKQSLINSESTDKHFTITMDDENYVNVKFGDGQFGAIPPVGSTITVYYEENVGKFANINGEDLSAFNTNKLAQYGPAGLGTTVLQTNISAISAGDFKNARDPDDNDVIRENTMSWARIQGRAVSPTDFEDAYELHHAIVKAKPITFSTLFKIASRNYTVTGATSTNMSAFFTSSVGNLPTYRDLSAYFDRPWQFVYGGATWAAFPTGASAFSIGPLDVHMFNVMGGANDGITLYPDYHQLVSGAMTGTGAASAQLGSGWAYRLVWSDADASTQGYGDVALDSGVTPFTTDLNQWLNDVAEPLINCNITYRVPEYIFMNLNINVERDPKYYGTCATQEELIKNLLWENFGMFAKNKYGVPICDFGSKVYLGEIENVIVNNVPGIISVTIPGGPLCGIRLTGSPSSPGTEAISSNGFAPYSIRGDSFIGTYGNLIQVTGQYYFGEVTGGAAYSTYAGSGAAPYISGHGLFYNSDERSVLMKLNQYPIFNINRISFT